MNKQSASLNTKLIRKAPKAPKPAKAKPVTAASKAQTAVKRSMAPQLNLTQDPGYLREFYAQIAKKYPNVASRPFQNVMNDLFNQRLPQVHMSLADTASGVPNGVPGEKSTTALASNLGKLAAQATKNEDELLHLIGDAEQKGELHASHSSSGKSKPSTHAGPPAKKKNAPAKKNAPTKSSPTKSSPTKSSPTKSSPTKSSPTKKECCKCSGMGGSRSMSGGSPKHSDSMSLGRGVRGASIPTQVPRSLSPLLATLSEKISLTLPPRPMQPPGGGFGSPMGQPAYGMQQAPVAQPQAQAMPSVQGRGRPAGSGGGAGMPAQTGVPGQPSAVAQLGGQSSTPQHRGFNNTPVSSEHSHSSATKGASTMAHSNHVISNWAANMGKLSADMSQLAMQQYMPTGGKRQFTPDEEERIREGESRWLPRIFQSYGAGGAGLGAGLGALAGGAHGEGSLKSTGIGAAIGAGLGGLGGGLLGYHSRKADNEGIKELIQRGGPGSTKRDLLADPVYQRDIDRGNESSHNRKT